MKTAILLLAASSACLSQTDYNTQLKNRPVISVKQAPYLAKGDGTHDDTAAIRSAVTAACLLANIGTANGSKIIFPAPSTYYLVSSTITLCSNLEVEGFRSKVHYSGAGSLFSLPLSQDGSVHGMVFEGAGTANTWAFTVTGTAGNGALMEHIYDNRFTAFGDVATHTGGGIQILADSAKMTVNNNFFTTNGAGFSSAANTDGLNAHDNYFADAGRGMDFSNESGSAGISANFNIFIGIGGAVRTTGAGVYTFIGNQYESTATLTNSHSAAFEFVSAAGIGPVVKFYANYGAIHAHANFCYWVDPLAGSSVFEGNDCSGSSPTGANQYAFHNGNADVSNRYSHNHIYAVAGIAKLYDDPSDPGIEWWPMSSANLTDNLGFIRGNASSYSSVASVSAATWVGNVATYTTVAPHTLVSNQIVSITGSLWTPSVAAISASAPLGYNTTNCFPTVTDTTHFTCPVIGDPGTYVSGGNALSSTQTDLASQDYTYTPTAIGNTMKRKGAGNGSGDSWGFKIQNAAATDGSRFFETSSAGTAAAWIGINSTGLYFPNCYVIGTGGGAIPVMKTCGVGNFSVNSLPVFANNAAAIGGGLAVGRFYRTGADPDPVMVVH